MSTQNSTLLRRERRFLLSLSPSQCPICKRNNFKSSAGLKSHFAACERREIEHRNWEKAREARQIANAAGTPSVLPQGPPKYRSPLEYALRPPTERRRPPSPVKTKTRSPSPPTPALPPIVSEQSTSTPSETTPPLTRSPSLTTIHSKHAMCDTIRVEYHLSKTRTPERSSTDDFGVLFADAEDEQGPRITLKLPQNLVRLNFEYRAAIVTSESLPEAFFSASHPLLIYWNAL
ncbi:hypothetical protein ONZ45_g17932 [Pleurotus djamor]|nr:hypothetical protein ONZ45_g17932 [Pleurotus djamor]